MIPKSEMESLNEYRDLYFNRETIVEMVCKSKGFNKYAFR